ncbi:MAG: DUF61 family protein [Desulfurococcales archaeon]|nr:DUF61 family protein [Desulfurococcales archaeon]
MQAGPTGRRARDALVKRYQADLGRIRASQAAEKPTLRELLERSPPTILLQDGTRHEVDQAQLQTLAKAIPRYLWGEVRLPFQVTLTRYDDGTRVYLVVGDKWQRRAIQLLLHGTLTPSGAEKLEPEEYRRLLRLIGSLVFTILNP